MKRIEDIITRALMVANDHNLTLNASGVLKLARNITEDIEKIIWHDAQGDDLPEIDREVVVICDDHYGGYKVCFGHRPDPKGWIGKPISYGKGEWNIPDVKWWLDVDIPKPE